MEDLLLTIVAFICIAFLGYALGAELIFSTGKAKPSLSVSYNPSKSTGEDAEESESTTATLLTPLPVAPIMEGRENLPAAPDKVSPTPMGLSVRQTSETNALATPLSPTSLSAVSAALTTNDGDIRRVIVVAKHLPINVKAKYPPSNGGSAIKINTLDELEVNWEDDRSFLSNLRALQQTPYNLDVLWIGQAQADWANTDNYALYAHTCKQQNCHSVDFPTELHDRWMNGFCKSVLWPMLHYITPISDDHFGEDWPQIWSAYEEANRRVADAVSAQVTSVEDCIWIHNYHFFLVPMFLRRAHPRSKIGFFIHTPFPSSDVFRTFPSREVLLNSLMQCDLIGFHTFDYARHFLSCIKRVLDLDFQTLPGGALGIQFNGRFVSILISHVGIASRVFRDASERAVIATRVQQWRDEYKDRKILLGWLDLDGVKGPMLKVQAIERFLSKNPEWHDRVTFVEVLQLSKNYGNTEVLSDEVIQELKRIQSLYGEKCLRIIEPKTSSTFSVNDQIALYRASAVACLSTFWDGLNLLPYEYTVSQDNSDPGALIISEFMGCSRSLSGVFRVNPWNLESVTDTILSALQMNVDERRANHARRFNYVMNHTIERWAAGYLEALHRAAAYTRKLNYVQIGAGMLALRSDFTRLPVDAVVQAYTHCTRRVIFLDYDGTITPAENSADKRSRYVGRPSASLLRLLKALSEDENSCVFLMSGRTRSQLTEWFGGLPQLGLAAEKGLFLRWPQRLSANCRMDVYKNATKVDEEEEEDLSEENDDESDDDVDEDAGYDNELVEYETIDEEVHAATDEDNDSSPTVSPSLHAGVIDSDWEYMANLSDLSWKSTALKTIQAYTEQTDGSWIEDKECGIMWHYDQADLEYGRMKALDLQKYLNKVLANPNVVVSKYDHSRLLEVKPHGVSKGAAVEAICQALFLPKTALLSQANVQTGYRSHSAAPLPHQSTSLGSSTVPPPPPFASAESSAALMSSSSARSAALLSGGANLPIIAPVFFMAVGDDRSDEDMFVSLNTSRWRGEKQLGRLESSALSQFRRTSSSSSEFSASLPTPLDGRVLSVASESSNTPRSSTIAPPETSSPVLNPFELSTFTVCVGVRPSAAHYYLEDHKEVLKTLNELAHRSSAASALNAVAAHSSVPLYTSGAVQMRMQSAQSTRHRSSHSSDVTNSKTTQLSQPNIRRRRATHGAV